MLARLWCVILFRWMRSVLMRLKLAPVMRRRSAGATGLEWSPTESLPTGPEDFRLVAVSDCSSKVWASLKRVSAHGHLLLKYSESTMVDWLCLTSRFTVQRWWGMLIVVETPVRIILESRFTVAPVAYGVVSNASHFRGLCVKRYFQVSSLVVWNPERHMNGGLHEVTTGLVVRHRLWGRGGNLQTIDYVAGVVIDHHRLRWCGTFTSIADFSSTLSKMINPCQRQALRSILTRGVAGAFAGLSSLEHKRFAW